MVVEQVFASAFQLHGVVEVVRLLGEGCSHADDVLKKVRNNSKT